MYMTNITISTSKISVPDEIFKFLSYILSNFVTPDLRKTILFNENEILRETFQRTWVKIFKEKSKTFYFTPPYSKDIEESFEYAEQCLKTFDEHSVFNTKIVKHKGKVREKLVENKEENAIFCLAFDYDEGTFNVSLKDFTINDFSKPYLDMLEYEIKAVTKKFSKTYTKKVFLMNFFDTLNEHKYIHVNGSVAVNMSTIYSNILVHFPDFEKLTPEKKIQVLLKGAIGSEKDIHFLGIRTVYALINANAVNNFICYDNNCDTVINYHSAKVYWDTVYDYVQRKRVKNPNIAKFVLYDTGYYKTSFSPHFMKDRLITAPEKNITRLLLRL